MEDVYALHAAVTVAQWEEYIRFRYLQRPSIEIAAFELQRNVAHANRSPRNHAPCRSRTTGPPFNNLAINDHAERPAVANACDRKREARKAPIKRILKRKQRGDIELVCLLFSF